MRFFLFAFAAVAIAAPSLNQVQTIYVMPMGNGIDQFLAARLTQFGKFQVVADPKAADAIMTDRLGDSFEAKLDELYGKPGEVAAPKAEVKKDDKEQEQDKDKEEAGKLKGDTQVRRSFGRGKGTFFIVDRKSRAVVWSIYERPKNFTPDELNKTANKVVKQLRHDLTPLEASRM